MVLVQNIKTNVEHGDHLCLFYVPVCFSSNVKMSVLQFPNC